MKKNVFKANVDEFYNRGNRLWKMNRKQYILHC